MLLCVRKSTAVDHSHKFLLVDFTCYVDKSCKLYCGPQGKHWLGRGPSSGVAQVLLPCIIDVIYM